MATKNRLEWKRARVREAAGARLRTWQARGAPYAVIHVRSMLTWLDSHGKKQRLSDRYLAVLTMRNESQVVISRHRTKRRAEESCERHLTKRPTTAQ